MRQMWAWSGSSSLFSVVFGCFQLAFPHTWLLLIFNIHRVPWRSWSTMEYHATYYIYIALRHFINELCTLDTVGHEALQFDVSSCRVEYAVFLFLRPGGACTLSGWPAFENMMKDDEGFLNRQKAFSRDARGAFKSSGTRSDLNVRTFTYRN